MVSVPGEVGGLQIEAAQGVEIFRTQTGEGIELRGKGHGFHATPDLGVIDGREGARVAVREDELRGPDPLGLFTDEKMCDDPRGRP